MIKKFDSKTKSPIKRKEVTNIVLVFSIIYILCLYLLGIYLGFYSSTIKFSTKTVINTILPLVFAILITEYIREKILQGNIKFKKILALAIVVIIDVILNINNYNLSSAEGFLGLIGYVVISSIVNNLLFNYICIRYGKTPNIVYRIITSIYVYVIPVTPDLHPLIQTLVKIVFPYIIYFTLEYIYSKEIINQKQKSILNIVNAILIFLMISITMLVSCKFKYGALVVGSGSMTGTINKGDVIVFEKYKNQNIKNNQIIVFKLDKRIIIHRVIEIKTIDGEKRYFTKGDANPEQDEDYRTDKDIVGVYKLRIEKIGILTLTFNKIFEGRKLC